MARDTVFVCSFSAGLDDIPRNKRGNRKVILTVLNKAKRFSVFEATFSPAIAKTLDALFKEGYLESLGGDFPWTSVRLTKKGLDFLREGAALCAACDPDFSHFGGCESQDCECPEAQCISERRGLPQVLSER